MMPARKAAGGKVRTIEGLEQDGKLHPVQDAYIRNFAFQCGYCTPGFIMSSVDLLESNKNPTEMDVREGIAGNLCRCTGYIKIIEAILDAAKATEK
jgi:carbon-monoxide dehydrogenase small subunit